MESKWADKKKVIPKTKMWNRGQKGKMSHCELMEEYFPFKSSMTSSEVERRSFNCNWLCTLASNGLQMAIEVFFLEAAEAVVVASPKSLTASTTRWWKTRQGSPISGQAVRFSTNSKTCQMAVIYYFQKLVGVVVFAKVRGPKPRTFVKTTTPTNFWK